jgi:hypothetical protein
MVFLVEGSSSKWVHMHQQASEMLMIGCGERPNKPCVLRAL